MKSKRVALPYVVWALLFILGPILITLFYAFGQDQPTLANIAKLLHRAEFRKALEVAPDAETMLAIIKESTGKK